MEKISHILSMLDQALGTTRKRHITGGILLSTSLLFGSLAITVMSLKTENNNYEQGY